MRSSDTKYVFKGKKTALCKKGQVWTTDYVIGMLLFLAVLLIMTKILLSMDIQEPPATYADAVHLSSELLTSGYPKNWSNDTVIIPGIAEDNRINMTQLEEYTKIPYGKTKSLHQMSSEYIFFFTNGTHVINHSRCVYGYNISTDENCSPQLSSIEYSDMSKIDRIVIINNTLERMTIYVWS